MNPHTTTKTVTLALLTALLGSGATAQAAPPDSPQVAAAKADIGKTLGFVPEFFLDLPALALPGTWSEMKSLQLNPATALPGKVKELIGLAVSAQVPCQYCIVAHTEFAKLNNATQAEIGEAVAMAALIRHWSTFLNGIQTDEGKFRGEIDKVVANLKQAAARPAAAGKSAPVVDGDSAVKEMTALFGGYVPEFLRTFPAVARAGAWTAMRDVQLNPATALSGKHKELIGLAVASQIPCRFCVMAHTEFAKLNGANDAEIKEAIAMAAFTRNMSTQLNGMQVDLPQFRRSVERLAKGARAAAAKQKASTTAQAH